MAKYRWIDFQNLVRREEKDNPKLIEKMNAPQYVAASRKAKYTTPTKGPPFLHYFPLLKLNYETKVDDKIVTKKGCSTGTLFFTEFNLCFMDETNSNLTWLILLDEITDYYQDESVFRGQKIIIKDHVEYEGHDIRSTWELSGFASLKIGFALLDTMIKDRKEWVQLNDLEIGEMCRLIATREIVTFDELLGIQKKYLYDRQEVGEYKIFFNKMIVPSDDRTKIILADIINRHNIYQNRFNCGSLEGFIDVENKQFINKNAHIQKTIEYKIAVSFNFDKNGAILLKCPNCGASKPLTEKKGEMVCPYCKNTFIIPEKILKTIA